MDYGHTGGTLAATGATGTLLGMAIDQTLIIAVAFVIIGTAAILIRAGFHRHAKVTERNHS